MRAKLEPSQIGAPGSINAYTLNGSFVPAYAHFILSHPATDYSPTTDRLHYYVGALETRAPAGTGGQPRQYAGVARSIFRLDSGTITDDLVNFQSTFDSFNDVVQGMVICAGPPDNTPNATDATTFVPVLLVTFGSGNPNPASTTQIGCYYRILSSDSATPWNAATSAANATYMTAWQITKAGPNLFAVGDSGTTPTLGDYRVMECPPGLNPLLVTSWGNGIEVGTPEWIINGLAAIGASPVVGKGDGLYYYDTQTRRYENVLKNFELVPHALNGKVTQAVTGGVVYTTYDGGAFFFDGVAVQEISPKKLWKLLGKDVGNARITAVADMGDSIIMLPEVGYQTTQNAGLDIRKVTSAGAATSITTNMVDGSLATGGDVGSLAATSFIDVWADIPFEGVVMYVTRASNSTTTAVFTDPMYSSATDTFTAGSGIVDGTRLAGNATTATSGGSLSFVGFPPSSSAGLVMSRTIQFGTLMQKIDFNYSSGTDITQKYGMRIPMSGSAFDSTTEIDELEIIPYRAGVPISGESIYAINTNFTHRNRSGLLQSVYELKRNRTVGFVPHEQYTLNTFGGTWAIAAHAGRLGQAAGAQNLGQSLVLWGRYVTAAISMGPTRDPSRDRYPITAQGSTTVPGPLWQIMYDWDAGDAATIKRLNWVAIDTRYLQPGDAWEVFAQHDEHDIISIARGKGGPIKFSPPHSDFRYMNMWLAVLRAATASIERAPQFLEPVIVDFEVMSDTAEWPRDRATQTPVAT